MVRKLENRFLVESSKTEKASFPCKTSISGTNVKTNKKVSTKRTYHKERSVASNNFIFLKIFFQFKNLLQKLIWYTNDANANTRTFCERWSFIWLCFFPVSILNESQISKKTITTQRRTSSGPTADRPLIHNHFWKKYKRG